MGGVEAGITLAIRQHVQGNTIVILGGPQDGASTGRAVLTGIPATEAAVFNIDQPVHCSGPAYLDDTRGIRC